MMRARLEELEAEVLRPLGTAPSLRPAAPAKGLDRLAREVFAGRMPEELATWFGWHDGQQPEAQPLVPTDAAPQLRFLSRTGRALSVEEALARRRGRRKGGGPDAACLPLFVIDEGEDDEALLLLDPAATAAGALRLEGWEGEWDGILAPSLGAWIDGVLGAARRAFGPFDGVELAGRRVLATTAVAAVQWGSGWYDVLGHFPRPRYVRTAYSTLDKHYGVRDRVEVAGVLDKLRVEDHARLAAATGRPPAELAVFDELRRAAVAGWAYAAYLLDEPTAWAIQVEVTRALQARYRGWEEQAAGYRQALVAWTQHIAGPDGLLEDDGGPEALLRAHDEALATLREAAWSPWRLVPWDVPLGDAVPPPAARSRVRPVSSADELHEALALADPGDAIELAAGTYRGAFTAEHGGVTLRPAAGARGGVTLESDGSGATLRGEAGLEVQGLRIVNASGAADQDGDAVDVVRSTLRLEDCDLEASALGIRTLGEWAHVSVRGGRIHGCGGAGLMLFTGHAVLEALEVDGCGGNGLQLADKGRRLVVDGGHLHDGGASAVAVFAAGEVKLRDTRVAGHPRPQLGVVAGSLEVEGCAIEHGGQGGVYAQGEGTRVDLDRSRLADHGAAHVEVLGGAKLWARDCQLETGAGDGVVVHQDGHAWLRRCAVRGAAGAGIFASERGRVMAFETTVEAAGRGVVSGTGAFVVASDLVVRGLRAGGDARPLALLAGEDAALMVARGQLEAVAGESAIQCVGEAQLALEALEITGGHGILAAGGDTYLTGCTLRGSAASALEVKGEARVVADDCAIDGSRFAAIECHGHGRVTLRECRIEGGEAALFAHDGGTIETQGGAAAGAVAAEARAGQVKMKRTRVAARSARPFEVDGLGRIELELPEPATLAGGVAPVAAPVLRLSVAELAEALQEGPLAPLERLRALVDWLLVTRLRAAAPAIEVATEDDGVVVRSGDPGVLQRAAEAIADAFEDGAPLSLAELRVLERREREPA